MIKTHQGHFLKLELKIKEILTIIMPFMKLETIVSQDTARLSHT